MPVSLPIYPDNKAIASGLKPEKGPLQFYNWQEYINQDVVNSFQKKYGVEVQISTFTTLDEAVAKIESRAVSTTSSVPRRRTSSSSSSASCCSPLNLDYIPNLEANVWPTLVNPWYDYGSQYTVPYTVYTTGYRLAERQAAGLQPRELLQPVERACGSRGRRSPA